MLSGGSRASQQETSTLQKRVFTRLDGRSVCGDPRSSASGGHLSIERMGWHAYKRHVLRTGCAKSPSVGRFLIPSGKSLETEKRSGVGAVERMALQVRQLDSRSTQTWCASNKKRPVRKKSPGWTKYRPKPVDPGRVTRPCPPRTPRF